MVKTGQGCCWNTLRAMLRYSVITTPSFSWAQNYVQFIWENGQSVTNQMLVVSYRCISWLSLTVVWPTPPSNEAIRATKVLPFETHTPATICVIGNLMSAVRLAVATTLRTHHQTVAGPYGRPRVSTEIYRTTPSGETAWVIHINGFPGIHKTVLIIIESSPENADVGVLMCSIYRIWCKFACCRGTGHHSCQ